MVSPRVEGATSAPRQKGWLTPQGQGVKASHFDARHKAPRAARGSLSRTPRLYDAHHLGGAGFSWTRQNPPPARRAVSDTSGTRPRRGAAQCDSAKSSGQDLSARFFDRTTLGTKTVKHPRSGQRTRDNARQQQGHACGVTVQSGRQGSSSSVVCQDTRPQLDTLHNQHGHHVPQQQNLTGQRCTTHA